MIEESLKYLEMFFDFEEILKENMSDKDIIKYYTINSFAYSIIHNKKFLHMGFTEKNNNFKRIDLHKPLDYIAKYINKDTKNILELACGRGSNSIELSKKYNDISFAGIDLTSKQLSYIKNNKIDFRKGDYHNLSEFNDESLDIVFIIEAFCHSNNKQQVFKEVYRILKKGGKFIVIDGYANIDKKKLTKPQETALVLTAKGMSVDAFEYYKDVVLYSKDVGFHLINERDKSEFVIPSMERIKRRISRISKLGILSKIIFKIMPTKIINNFISGYLMPDLIKNKIATYMISIFEK